MKVRLYVTAEIADDAFGTRVSRADDEDETEEDETSAANIVPSTAIVTEGGHYYDEDMDSCSYGRGRPADGRVLIGRCTAEG